MPIIARFLEFLFEIYMTQIANFIYAYQWETRAEMS